MDFLELCPLSSFAFCRGKHTTGGIVFYRHIFLTSEFIQRSFNVDETSLHLYKCRYIDVNVTLYKRHVPLGVKYFIRGTVLLKLFPFEFLYAV